MGNYVVALKIASPPRQMDGSSANLHAVVPWSVRIQDVLRVKVRVKGHDIWAILSHITVIMCTHSGALYYLNSVQRQHSESDDVLISHTA